MDLTAGLYAITRSTADSDVMVAAVSGAIRGGAVVVQYREKALAPAVRYRQARSLRDHCREAGALFIVNDDPVLARAVQADGVHLGEHDAVYTEARQLLGAKALIGVSCYNSLDRARLAQAAGADYIAFGSFYSSASKPGAVRTELSLLREARTQLAIPIAAIGGITPENGMPLITAGAHWLAVIEGVFGQADPEAAARRFRNLFHQAQATQP